MSTASVGLSQISNLGNLKRAWRWVQNNTDSTYSDLCQHSITDYSKAADDHLRQLRNYLRRDIYYPEPSRKIFLPKPSGMLRPYTVLAVTDQIVYQAIANLVAEQLQALYRKSELVSFSHIY